VEAGDKQAIIRCPQPKPGEGLYTSMLCVPLHGPGGSARVMVRLCVYGRSAALAFHQETSRRLNPILVTLFFV
jgi:hypothetical protein